MYADVQNRDTRTRTRTYTQTQTHMSGKPLARHIGNIKQTRGSESRVCAIYFTRSHFHSCSRIRTFPPFLPHTPPQMKVLKFGSTSTSSSYILLLSRTLLGVKLRIALISLALVTNCITLPTRFPPYLSASETSRVYHAEVFLYILHYTTNQVQVPNPLRALAPDRNHTPVPTWRIYASCSS